MTETELDKERADAFGERMLGTLNSGALSLMMSVGHRTGLFDTMRGMAPSTSVQIAEAAGLNERYVMEWLGAMLTGGIVECDSQGRVFSLPLEHAVWLTREAAPDNIAAFAQYIPLLGTVEDKIIDCFKQGGGAPYSAYERFHEVMADAQNGAGLGAMWGEEKAREMLQAAGFSRIDVKKLPHDFQNSHFINRL